MGVPIECVSRIQFYHFDQLDTSDSPQREGGRARLKLPGKFGERALGRGLP